MSPRMRNSCNVLAVAWVGLVFAVGCVSRSPARNVGSDAPTGDAPSGGDGKPQTNGGVYLLNETFNEIATGTTPMSPWTTTTSPQGSVIVAPMPFAVDHS